MCITISQNGSHTEHAHSQNDKNFWYVWTFSIVQGKGNSMEGKGQREIGMDIYIDF